MLDLFSKYSEEQIKDLCARMDTVIKDPENKWLSDFVQNQIFRKLSKNYKDIYLKVKPVIDGDRKISLSSLEEQAHIAVFVLEYPFEKLPLLINARTPFKYKHSLRQKNARELERDINVVCKFRLDLGK